MNVSELVAISRYAGLREDLVQAAGGNSSLKLDDQSMLIKASGVPLDEVSETYGWSLVNYAKLAGFLVSHRMEKLHPGDDKSILQESLIKGARPSVETFMHALTDRVTLHTHPILVNVLTSREGGMEELKSLFPEALFVGYDTPGIPLAQHFYQVIQPYREQNLYPVVFLKNHGMMISGPSANAVIEQTEAVVQKTASYLGIDDRAFHDTEVLFRRLKELGMLAQGDGIYLSSDASVIKAAHFFGEKCWPVAISPDGLTYCGRAIFPVTETTDRCTADFFKRQYGLPKVIYFRGSIYLTGPTLRIIRGRESTLHYCADVAIYSLPGKPDVLSRIEQDVILGPTAAH